MIPYEDEDVTEILIDGAPDWLPVKRGSFEAILVGKDNDAGTPKRMGLRAVDKMDGQEVFFYTDRLVAVKYTTEDQNTVGITPMDGRMLP